MKRICTILVFLFFISAIGLSADFYDINAINDVYLYFEADDWDAQLDQLMSKGREERLLGQVVINGEVYDSVGVRYKGNSSYSVRQIKNPLNIKLDWFKDQKHDGYGTIKLSNAYKDPSFIRETLSYEIAQKYMPASKANYARVYVNDAYLGFYVSVQDVDKSFVETHFGSKDNAFFKGELTNDSPNTSTKVWGYFGPDSASYMNYYERESASGWSDLIDFLDVLNNDASEVGSVLNVDRHLWMLAFDILFVNLDAPINFGHNYYLYQDESGRFNPIMWDLNENFGGFSMLLGQSGSGVRLNLPQLDLFLNSENPTYPIVNKILSNSTYKKMYAAHLKTIFQEAVDSGWYISRARELQAKIAAEVALDNNKFYSVSDFAINLESTIAASQAGPGSQPIIGLKELMDSRADYLKKQVAFTAPQPRFVSVPSAIYTESQVWISAEIEDADNAVLAARDFGRHVFQKIEMYDDGMHQDSSANDGIFGAMIDQPSPSMQYYVYAENSEAAAFSPARAEFEFYTLSGLSDLVINEFMAENDSLYADEAGEYDDWIELYNAGNVDLALAGYFLSDDADELTKWSFPDATIPAGGYLIIWADKDSDQSGLHADFKLSADGEGLYVLSPDTMIIDQVLFAAQASNVSFGRFPNGTGSFSVMTPSFLAPNENPTTQTESIISTPAEFELQQNYPNPFNAGTTISFELPMVAQVSLKIYDILGRSIETLIDGAMSAGVHQAIWNANDVPSGVYFYKLEGDKFRATRKMSLIR